MKPVIALDIETTGLMPWTDQIHMCGLYDGTKYICIRPEFSEMLEELLETDYADYDIVGHRTDFDIKFLYVHKWLSKPLTRTIHDTRIIGSLVRNRVPKTFIDAYNIEKKAINKTLPKGMGHRKVSYLSLKVMAPWYLKVPAFWETTGDHNNEKYNELDCMYTYRLYCLLAPRLQDEGSWDFYLARLLEWSKMTMEMEIQGIILSQEELVKVEEEYQTKGEKYLHLIMEQWAAALAHHREREELEVKAKYMAMAEAQIEKGRDPYKTLERYKLMADKALTKIKPFNFASPDQMSWLLKDYLNLDIEDMDGEESTDKAVLNRLASEGREDIKNFLQWREANKVLTMYTPTYRKLEVDGVIHPNFNITGTRTGRTSSSGPNLQQVPSKLYRLFRPRPGRRFIKYDLSGIEAALIALYSGDKTLYDILEKGESIHDHNAKAMFNLSCDVGEVSTRYPKERKTVKNIGFACFYGAGWRRISKVFAAGGFPISDNTAKEKLKLLKSYYPTVFDFHKEITEVFEAGETVTNMFGRPINLQAHDNPYMQGFNTLIQSAASDLNLRACEKVWKKWKEEGLDAYPLLVIHDCIIAEAEHSIAEQAEKDLVQAMTCFKLESVNGPIQLRVEGGISDIWEK